jgi:hypothetical protein
MPAIAGDLRDPVKQDPPPMATHAGKGRLTGATQKVRTDRAPRTGCDPACLPGRTAGFQRSTESSQA